MKTEFKFLGSTSNKKRGTTYNREILFSADHFKYVSYKKNLNETPLEISVEKTKVGAAYKKFRKQLINAKFFFATDDEMVDYEGIPENNWSDTYSVSFIWLWSGKAFDTFELHDDTYYCLDYKARDRFAPFILFLDALAEGKKN